MNQEIISRKLLLISTLISVSILLYMYLTTRINPRLKIWVCNSEDKINILVQKKTYDILINPIGEKEVLDCLGRTIPFFDRTLDSIFSDNQELINSLAKRYEVKSVYNDTVFTIGNKEFNLQDSLLVKEENKITQIYQRPLTTIDPLWNTVPVHTILMALSSSLQMNYTLGNMQVYMLDEGEILMLP